MIYADYNGSAPLNKKVTEYLKERLETGPFANPNALHYAGREIKKGMESCRKKCAELLGADKKQIIFNSGSSEGITHLFHSLLSYTPQNQRDIIIISSIEHAVVHNCAQFFAPMGYEVRTLPVNSQGVVDTTVLKKWLDQEASRVALLCTMAANNETGVVQPIQEIGQLCQKHHIPFVSDTTQYIGKTPFKFNELPIDYAVVSGHKIGALTGVGMVLAKGPHKLQAFIQGGGQENGLRGGTQNYIGIETLTLALEDSMNHLEEKLQKAHDAKKQFEEKMKKEFPSLIIIGDESTRLAGTTLFSYPGLHGQAIQIELESVGIYVTTSSACSDNSPATSRVIKAMGYSDDVGRGIVRIGLGLENCHETYGKLFEALKMAINKLLKISSY